MLFFPLALKDIVECKFPGFFKNLVPAGCQWIMPVNRSYSGGKNQEDLGSKPAWANSHKTLS
jgi:hypothetical protein